VLFLLVHHSASSNDYSEEDVPDILRGFFDYHTSPEKGWYDIAYNFLIDRFGGLWEGRSGSLAGPIAGDASGGNQGFSQLVCLIGDFSNEPPTAEATDSLVSVIAWLAHKYDISAQPGAQVEFVSRGSNRWPAGEKVVTPPVAGHRDMSITSCPGDALYPYVVGDLLSDAEALWPKAATASTTSGPPTTTVAEASVPSEPTQQKRSFSTSSTQRVPNPAVVGNTGDSSKPLIRGIAGLAIAAVMALIIKRRRDHAQARSLDSATPKTGRNLGF